VANPALHTPLLGLFDERQPESKLQRVWQGIRSRREARHNQGRIRRQWRPIVATACAVALTVIALFAVPWSHRHEVVEERAIVVPASIEPTHTPRQIDFGYGAYVSVGVGAQLDVLEQSEHSVVLALRHGISRFDIRPGGARRWRIESGGVSVEVVGTQFTVERKDNAVRVEVQRGRVLLRGPSVPDQVQALDAGRSLAVAIASTGDQSLKEAQAGAPAAMNPLPPRSINSRAPTGVANAGNVRPDSSDWRSAATRHDWTLAWQTLGPEGLAREVARTDDVADLLVLADVARLTGHPNDALKPLRQIVGGHAKDPRSAMAAFTLGRVLLDSLGNPVQAAFAFERAMYLKLPTSLAEDAQARLVEAQARSGAVVQARAAANVYRARYPGGRRLSDVNHWSPPE